MANLDWVVPDPEVDKLGASGTSEFDTVVLGRKTYEMFGFSSRRHFPQVRSFCDTGGANDSKAEDRRVSSLFPKEEPKDGKAAKSRDIQVACGC